MAKVPDDVRPRIDARIYERTDPGRARDAIRSLGVEVPEVFRDFYEAFEGPFGSEKTAVELLDVCSGKRNIVKVTAQCREEYGWPPRMIVLTELLGNAVLVLDAVSGYVYDVDFEGGDRELLEGSLAPKWRSFGDFLSSYF